MYNVSSDYFTAISQPVRTFKIEACFSYKNAARSVFDDDSITGEVTIESQAVSGSASCGIIDIGAVPSATASLTIIDSEAGLKKYVGSSFTVRVSLLLENGEYEDVPMGTFYCDSSKTSRTGNRISIYGYDAMISFKYTLTDVMRGSLTDKTPQEAAEMLTQYAKCEFDQDLSGFPNSGLQLDFSNTQVVTGWDGIMWIAQLMGCFARISRENKLEFVQIKSTWDSDTIVSVKDITGSERYKTTFSDDRIHIAGVSMSDANNNLVTRSGAISAEDSNVTIALEKNPLIKSTSALKDILDNILTPLQTAYFYAFRSEIINDPALDVGDTVHLRGGEINGVPNNELVGFITHNTWRYRGRQEIVNTGQTVDTAADPAQSYAQPKSQSEKLLDSVSGSTNQMQEQVNSIKKTVVLGVERAKKLQTKDFSNSPRYYPSAMQTLNINDIIGKYADTLDGAAGFVLCEDRTGNATNMERARMTVEYRKNEAGFNPIHSMNCITRVRPVNTMLNGYYDEMNFAAYGESLCAQGGFRGYTTLSCNGLWVSSDPVNNTTPRYLDLFHANYLNSEDKYTISFVIANVQFEIKDDGIHITRPSTTLHSDSGRTVFIPWDT